MKKDSGKIAVMGVISLLVAIGTLIGAAVIADVNSKEFSSDLPDNNFYANESPSESSDSREEASVSSEESSSNPETSSEEEPLPEETVPSIETGIYTLSEDSIVITSGEAGFVEGNINCGGVTMEFSGQTVDNTLVATGTDSLNNTVEITLIFAENTITASSRPLIRYEEASDYLKLSGTFSK